jgi:predicted dehydrogenase
MVAETGELIANHVPGQIALHGRLGSGALLSLSVHGGSAAAPDGFAITITGTEGTLTITPADPGHYPGWAQWRVRLRGTDGAAASLPVPDRYRVTPDGVPAGPAANIAALYREVAQAITEGRPAHPGFGTAVHHQRTLAAIERAAKTGVRQTLTAPDHTEGKIA